jgi:hypothetical protein
MKEITRCGIVNFLKVWCIFFALLDFLNKKCYNDCVFLYENI